MTREEVLAMEPGRELDCMVAEYVFGYLKVPGPTTDYDGPCESFDVLVPPTIDDPFSMYPSRGAIKPWWFCRKWSTDINYALNVANKFWAFDLSKRNSGADWIFIIRNSDDEQVWAGVGKDAPEAICKAALLWALNL